MACTNAVRSGVTCLTLSASQTGGVQLTAALVSVRLLTLKAAVVKAGALSLSWARMVKAVAPLLVSSTSNSMEAALM